MDIRYLKWCNKAQMMGETIDALRTIRKKIKTEEFDYSSLMQILGHYKKPRDIVTRLLKKDILIRVKKGLYVFAPDYRRGPICKGSLANLIYGPSYVSLEYALSHYGLIPERVEHMTSITPLKCFRSESRDYMLLLHGRTYTGLLKIAVKQRYGLANILQHVLHS